jgi:hypothetical protein
MQRLCRISSGLPLVPAVSLSEIDKNSDIAPQYFFLKQMTLFAGFL